MVCGKLLSKPCSAAAQKPSTHRSAIWFRGRNRRETSNTNILGFVIGCSRRRVESTDPNYIGWKWLDRLHVSVLPSRALRCGLVRLKTRPARATSMRLHHRDAMQHCSTRYCSARIDKKLHSRTRACERRLIVLRRSRRWRSNGCNFVVNSEIYRPLNFRLIIFSPRGREEGEREGNEATEES